MRVRKPSGSVHKVSLSPSRALMNEIERQVNAGIWESKTEFFEAAAWFMIELQGVGADAIRNDYNDAYTADEREIAESMASINLSISEGVHDDE